MAESGSVTAGGWFWTSAGGFIKAKTAHRCVHMPLKMWLVFGLHHFGLLCTFNMWPAGADEQHDITCSNLCTEPQMFLHQRRGIYICRFRTRSAGIMTWMASVRQMSARISGRQGLLLSRMFIFATSTQLWHASLEWKSKVKLNSDCGLILKWWDLYLT